MWTPERLIAFEDRVKEAFLAKRVRAPIHLSGGNESELIAVFQEVQPLDYVFSTYRSHYHALLKGIPEEWVFDEILAGRSMYLMSADHRLFSSAIVAGALPIACGVAAGIKQRGGSECCWCFIGDMAARTGLCHEFTEYCRGHALPVCLVIEDNGFSTDTLTEEVWGLATRPLPIRRYQYRRTHPHVGCAVHVNF